MNGAAIPIGFYVRLPKAQANGSLPLADLPAWEICCQEIHPIDESGIELGERVLATGLTLRQAWTAMVALASPRRESKL